MDNNRYCIIMAGGIGSRFWPISRRTMPKQFLDMLGTGKSFIRHTYERFAKIVPPENFLVVTNGSYKPLVLEHIPEIDEDQILSEPVGRNTAPCIAYAAWRLRVAAPDATMIVTPSDHLILDEDEFRRAIVESAEFAERQRALMTIGIRPDRPATGYGYIQVDNQVRLEQKDVYKVKTFTEKPNLELARSFVESGEFFWNSGIFIWKVDAIMENFERLLPHTQPKGWRSPAAGRNDDNGPLCTAGRIRQERQGTRPTETKTDRHTTGIRKSGHSRSACAESWNAPFYSSSAADPNGHTAESIGQTAPQSSGSALKPASETARTTASEGSSVSIVSNFSGEARSIDHSSGLAILFSCSPILATHPPHLALVLNLFFIG